jgi:predicted solute-binding protein
MKYSKKKDEQMMSRYVEMYADTPAVANSSRYKAVSME